MALFNIPWLTESIKKGTIKYLIELYLGQFLENELQLKQLDIELFNGVASLEDIALNIKTINNELLSLLSNSTTLKQLKLTKGTIDRIEFSIPWSTLWQDSCTIELTSIDLNFILDNTNDPNSNQNANQTSILSKSMMISSMEMAEDILQQESEKYEGLEKFAQLINSIIRRVKLIAKDVRIKLKLPSNSSNEFRMSGNSFMNNFSCDDDELELKIDYIKCEEEEIELESKDDASNDDNGDNSKLINGKILSEQIIKKSIQIENIEISINRKKITKLYGKHLIKLQLNDKSLIDLNIYISSYIFALLSIDNLKFFQNLYSILNQSSYSNQTYEKLANQKPQERPMTAKDYRCIKEFLHREKFLQRPKGHQIDGGKDHNSWTSNNLTESIDEFKSFHENDQGKSNGNSSNTSSMTLQCNIKIPGIVFCLLTGQSLPNSDEQQIEIPNLDNLIGINSFLDDLLQNFNHLRLLASNLCINIMNDDIEFNCMNINLYEYYDNEILDSVLSMIDDSIATTNNDQTNSGQTNSMIKPSIRLNVNKNNNIHVQMAPISIKLDPTIIERHWKLFEWLIGLFSDTNNDLIPYSNIMTVKNSSELKINFDCKLLLIELFFPVPDLRPERSNYSSLHDESLLIKLIDISALVSNDFGEFLMKELLIDLRCLMMDNHSDETLKLFQSKSNEKNIKFYYSTSIKANDIDDDNNNDTNLMNNSMSESTIHIDTMNTNNSNNKDGSYDDPFMYKQNLFDGTNNSNERIIIPGDYDYCRHFLSKNRSRTKFFAYIYLTFGEIYLHNKQIFELIYNRFVNDLVLWSPFIPPPPQTDNDEGLNFKISNEKEQKMPPKLLLPMLDDLKELDEEEENMHKSSPFTVNQANRAFYSCNNQQQNDELMVENESVIDSDEQSYHSLIMENDDDDDGAPMINDNNHCGKTNKINMNDFQIEFEIDFVHIEFDTESAKSSMQLFIENFIFGLVADQSKTSICLCSRNFQLKSAEKQSIVVNNTYMNPASKSELNLALQIQRFEMENLKKIKLTVQFKNSLLLGIDLATFEQLWQFLNVKDDPILGYVCPRIIIELHVDLTKCGILFDGCKDLNGQQLTQPSPQRQALIHFEDIYLTSMVIENTNETILRFFIEEFLFCFKRNLSSDNDPDSAERNTSIKQFVPIIDTDIIDLVIRIGKNNQIELKCWNNEINLKLCYDSFCELLNFLQRISLMVDNAAGSIGQKTCDLSDMEPNPSSDTEIRSSNQSKSCVDEAKEPTVKSEMNSNELLADALSECLMTAGHESANDEVSNMNTRNEKCRCSNDPLLSNPRMDESNFLILGENDLGSGINIGSEPRVRCLTDEPIKIIENHFPLTQFNGIPDISPLTIARYLLDRMSLNVYLYDGKDFEDETLMSENSGENSSKTRDTDIKDSVKKNAENQSKNRVRFKNDSNSILWENIDLISTTSKSSNNRTINSSMMNPIEKHFTFKTIGGHKRKMDTYIVLVLKRIRILFDRFVESSNEVNDQCDDMMSDAQLNDGLRWILRFMVQEIEILDRVNISKINKILYEYYSEQMPRRQYSNMFSIRMLCKKNCDDNFNEIDLIISLKPLRINLDQDTLLFLMNFFSKFNDCLINDKFKDQQNNQQTSTSTNEENITDFNQVKSKDVSHTKATNVHFTSADNDSHNDNDEDSLNTLKNDSKLQYFNDQSTAANDNNQLFIKSFQFLPEVPIRLDYHGKHIDLKQGALPGIALGLAQLNQSELYLKKLSNKHGLLGLDKVLQYAIDEWSKDIKRNQLPSILGGVGPMHSFIQLFQGIRDLFWIPIDQYRRDQRLVRGIQRGAYAFSVSTAMATLELANRLVVLIQNTAQFAHNVVTPPGNNPAGVGGISSGFGTHPYNRNQQLMPIQSQPRDLREGFTVAYAVIREGLHDTFRGMTNTNLVADDTVTVIGEVVRQIPSTVVRPIIHLSQATSSVLVGFRNQLTPEARKDDQEKWKNVNDW